MRLEFSRQIFEKYSNIKFHKNSLSGTEVLHAHRRTNMTVNSRFLQSFKPSLNDNILSIPAYVTKAYGRGIETLFLNTLLNWRSGQFHIPALLSLRNEPLVLI
jgi:hypothetical protein